MRTQELGEDRGRWGGGGGLRGKIRNARIEG